MQPSRGAILLREWRVGEGLSQNAAAKRFAADHSTYANWEVGRVPTLSYAARIEDVTKIAMRSWLELATPATQGVA